jgi:hypothetical protein
VSEARAGVSEASAASRGPAALAPPARAHPEGPGTLSLGQRVGLFAFVSAIFVLVFAVFLWVQPEGDLETHIGYARSIQSVGNIQSPHFLLQLLLRGLYAIGLPYRAGMALLLGACYGGMAVLIARELQRRGARLPLGLAWLMVTSVLLASHVFLFTAAVPNFYYGYFVPIAYHNPTQQLCKLFGLWIWFRYSAHFLGNRRPSWRQASATGVLCVLSAISKPSFLIAFLPLAGGIALVDLARRRIARFLQFALAVAAPAALVLLAQAAFTYGEAARGTLLFAPFAVFDPYQTLFKLPLSILFPLAALSALAIGRTHPAGDDSAQGSTFVAAWLFAAVALFETLFLAEADFVQAGNFAWTGQMGVFLLYVESMLWLICRPRRLSRRHADVIWAIFGLHVLSGLIWYGVVFLPTRGRFL